MSERESPTIDKDTVVGEKLAKAVDAIMHTLWDNPRHAWSFYELCLTASHSADERAVRMVIPKLIEEGELSKDEADGSIRLSRYRGRVEIDPIDTETAEACEKTMRIIRENGDHRWRPLDLRLVVGDNATSFAIEHLCRSGALTKDPDKLIRLSRDDEQPDLSQPLPAIPEDWG